MIIDSLRYAALYSSLGSRFEKAFHYLSNTDLLALPAGRQEIEGDEVFALVNIYDTKNASEGMLEAHRLYADVQYIVTGEELIGVSLLNGQEPTKAYDREGDYALYKEPFSAIRVAAGMFAIFFPQDLHQPGIQLDQPLPVRKVVVKVQL